VPLVLIFLCIMLTASPSQDAVTHYREQAVICGREPRIFRIRVHNPLVTIEPSATLEFPEFEKKPLMLPRNRFALSSIGFRPDDHVRLGIFGLAFLFDLTFTSVGNLHLNRDHWVCCNNDVIRWAIGLKEDSQTSGIAICALSNDLQIDHEWVDRYVPSPPPPPCSWRRCRRQTMRSSGVRFGRSMVKIFVCFFFLCWRYCASIVMFWTPPHFL